MARTTSWNWVRRATIAVAVVIVVLGMGSVLAVTLAGKFGDVALGMKTGSMRPGIDPGDLVFVRKVDPRAIRVGEIITFRRPNEPSEIYTHRVVSISYSGNGQVAFKTKGDANPIPDPWTVSYQGAAMRVVHHVRYGGIVLRISQSMATRRVIAVSIFVIVLALLWPVLVTPKRDPRDETIPTVPGVA